MPGSTSNLGAGFDVFGLALNRYVTARYEPGDGALTVERGGTLASLTAPPEQDTLVRAFVARLAELGVERPGGVIRAESEIPLARGLGSSAAAVVAGWLLAGAAAGSQPWTFAGDDVEASASSSRGVGAEPATDTRGSDDERQAALAWAEAWEGHPDNVAPSIFGGLVAVARDATGRVRAFPLPLADGITFVFAAPGRELPTPVARAALPADVPHALATRALGRVAALARGLATGDVELLRIGFTDELHVPHRLPLIPGGAQAIAAAREAGAWAATISGSGTGLIAVCSPDAAEGVASAMRAAFAAAIQEPGDVAFAALPDRDGARVLAMVGV